MLKSTLVSEGIVVTGCDSISHCPSTVTGEVSVNVVKPLLVIVTVSVAVAPTCKVGNVTVLTPSVITTWLIVTSISGTTGIETIV